MEGRRVVLMTDVSSPRGFVITTVFLRVLSSGSLILSKYFGEMKENVVISFAPRAAAVFITLRVNFCAGVSSPLATPLIMV